MQTAIMNFSNPPDPDGDWGPSLYSTVAMSPMTKGLGWEVWKNAVLARGIDPSLIVETTTNGYNTIAFNGMAGIHVSSMANLTLFGHAPPAAYLQAVKSASRVNTKIGLYFYNPSIMSHQVSFSAFFDSVDAIALANLRNTGVGQTNVPAGNPNVGCVFADQTQTTYDNVITLTVNEGPAPCGTLGSLTDHAGHTWIVNMESSSYRTAYLTEVRDKLVARYPAGLIDYVMFDNVLDSTFWSTATNAEAAYSNAVLQAAWKAFMVTATSLLAPIGVTPMGNCPLFMTNYSNTEVRNRYGEHFFHDEQNSGNATSEDEATINSRLTAGATQQLTMLHSQIKSSAAAYNARSFSATHVDNWSGKEDGPGGVTGSWTNILALSRQLGLTSSLYAVVGRSSGNGTFPIFWQPAFRVPS